MTKQHFIAFAKQIKFRVDLANTQTGHVQQNRLSEARAACDLICEVAPDSNPNFKRDVFVKACGL